MCDILFVTGNTRPYGMRESVDSALLATILDNNKQSVEILSFYDLWDENYQKFCNSLIKAIIDSGCKLVIFQSFVYSFLVMLRIAEKLKACKPEIKNLFFGEQITNTGSKLLEYMPFVDYIYVGEPEKQIVNITKNILSNNIADLNKIQYLFFKNKIHSDTYDNEENIADVENLPNINLKFIKSAIDDSNDLYFPLNVGRGCPYRCTYCNICTSRSRRYRLMSTEKIIKSIKFYIQLGISKFQFTHDSFFVNKDKVFELCDSIKKENLNIKLSVAGRIDNVSTELLDQMIECGFDDFCFGIETGSHEMQIKINKKLDLEKAYQKLKYLKEKNVHVETYFMFGFPEENEQNFNETLNYIIDLMIIGVNVMAITCYFATGSNLYNKYYEKLEFDEQNYSTLNNIVFSQYEKEWILAYKPIFAYMYNYKNIIRTNYKYFSRFIRAFKKYPNTLFYLREAYGKEKALNIYNDFMRCNKLTDLSYNETCNQIENTDITIPKLLNNLSQNKHYNILKEIYKFERDLNNIKTNQTFVNTYYFSYNALKNKSPIDSLHNTASNLLICRIGNKININLMQ